MTIASIKELASNSAHQLLQSIEIEQVLATREKSNLVYAKESTSINDFIALLEKYKILAAPIMQDSGRCDQIVGMVSITDVISFAFKQETFDITEWTAEESREKLATIQKTPVMRILESIPSCKFPIVLRKSDSVYDLVTALSTGEVHRVLIHHQAMPNEPLSLPTSNHVSIISQYDVVKYLYGIWKEAAQNESELKECATILFDLPLPFVTRLCKPDHGHVIAIEEYQPIVAAFTGSSCLKQLCI